MRPDGVRDSQNLSGKRSPPRTAKRSPPRAVQASPPRTPRDPPVQIKAKMRAPVKGVEVERELEQEKSFHGSVSELRKPVKANPAFVQFAWENEPHWMFVLFFSHFLFWLEARAGVRATDALARSPRTRPDARVHRFDRASRGARRTAATTPPPIQGMPNYSGDASHFYSNGKYNGDGGIPSARRSASRRFRARRVETPSRAGGLRVRRLPHLAHPHRRLDGHRRRQGLPLQALQVQEDGGEVSRRRPAGRGRVPAPPPRSDASAPPATL